jgi:hypothetical protein
MNLYDKIISKWGENYIKKKEAQFALIDEQDSIKITNPAKAF